MDTEALTFEQFVDRITETLELETDSPGRSSSIQDDLMLDSQELMELLLVVEQMGRPLPEDIFTSVATIGELYDYYVLSLQIQRS